MYGRNKQEVILKSLLNHLDFLNAVVKRHEHWINDISDRELEEAHLEIIGLLREASEKYLALVDKYNSHNK